MILGKQADVTVNQSFVRGGSEKFVKFQVVNTRKSMMI